MVDKVGWDKVQSWLKKNGATVKLLFSNNDGVETHTYEVSRGMGPFKTTTRINAMSFTFERGDGSGVRDRTPLEVVGESVASAAADLRIRDASEVLGPNWKNEYPQDAAAEARNEERDAAKADRLHRPRRGSLREPPDGPFEKDHDGDGEGEREEDTGEVR